MLDGDALCRAALYPKFISNGVFDDEALLNFQSVKGANSYAMSLASYFLCKSEAGVHGYGCAAAKIANDRFVIGNERAPKPVDEEVHYLGYYKITYGDLVDIPMEHYTIGCKWKPENGLDVHFEAEFFPKGTGTKKERRQDRTAAVGLLADKTFGPRRFLADKDLPYRAELEAIHLPVLPKI